MIPIADFPYVIKWIVCSHEPSDIASKTKGIQEKGGNFVLSPMQECFPASTHSGTVLHVKFETDSAGEGGPLCMMSPRRRRLTLKKSKPFLLLFGVFPSHVLYLQPSPPALLGTHSTFFFCAWYVIKHPPDA